MRPSPAAHKRNNLAILLFVMEQALPSLEDLQTFLFVAQEGSVTGAARKQGLPKSTISRRLTRLEEAVGVRLVQRTTRQLTLTEDGHAFREQVTRALNGLEEATLFLRDRRETPRGHVKVTAPYDYANSTLAPIVAEFVRTYPETTVELVVTERLVDLVADGIDLAVRGTGNLPDSSLVARKVIEGHLRLYASPAYLKKVGVPKTVKQVAKYDFIHMKANQGRAKLVFSGPGGNETLDVRAVVSASELSFVMKAAEEGLGLGVVPDIAAVHEVKAGRLVPVLPEHTLGKSGIYVVHPGGRLLPARVRALRDLLIERLSVAAA